MLELVQRDFKNICDSLALRNGFAAVKTYQSSHLMNKRLVSEEKKRIQKYVVVRIVFLVIKTSYKDGNQTAASIF